MEGLPRVLVVDDDASVLLLLTMVMEEEGFAVTGVSSCASALEQVATDPPDVVVLDLHLPDGNGSDVLKALQADEKSSDIPVVVMTGTTEGSRVVELLDAGAHDYLAKPVDISELIARTRAALRIKAVRDELTRQARTDALTGLPNRRALDEAVKTWRAHVMRTGEPLSVALFDVVDFKGVNDVCGHDTGDRVLRSIGEALRSVARASDVLGRWGGDEFLAVLPISDAAQAEAIVSRMQNAVRTEVLLPGRVVELRAGIAQHTPDLEAAKLIDAAAIDLHDRRRASS